MLSQGALIDIAKIIFIFQILFMLQPSDFSCYWLLLYYGHFNATTS